MNKFSVVIIALSTMTMLYCNSAHAQIETRQIPPPDMPAGATYRSDCAVLEFDSGVDAVSGASIIYNCRKYNSIAKKDLYHGWQKISDSFEGGYTLRFHLAPPLLARHDPKSGQVKKMAFGPWMLTGFKWLAKARRYRGSRWDVFGRSDERQLERRLLADYEADLAALLPVLQRTTLIDAIALARLPEKIRGFGHVKRRCIDAAAPERAALKARLGLC